MYAACTKKNDFVTAAKFGTTNNFFVPATKNFAGATKRFVVVTKYFVVPILTNDFVGVTKPFTPCDLLLLNYLKVSRVSETTDF